MADNLLIQKVIDGKIDKVATKTTSEEVETRGTSNLGKDAFLQLLVAEMQNQDPLEPSSNTEWISQLATFSQLEELQSLTSTAENSQIFSLVGKQVIVTTESPAGGKLTKSGIVDYVTYNGGEAKFSIDGSLYSMENLNSVVGESYHYDQNKPSVVKVGEKYTFDGDAPQDVQFEVKLGSDVAEAKNVALAIGNTVLPSDYVILNGNTVTVKSELLQELDPGVYNFDVVFDDRNYTTVKDALSITVFNPHPTTKEQGSTETPKNEGTSSEGQNVSGSTGTKNADDTAGNSGSVSGEKDDAAGVDNSAKHNMQPGDLKGFDYDAVRALYPELTDEEFEHEYGYLFLDDEG